MEGQLRAGSAQRQRPVTRPWIYFEAELQDRVWSSEIHHIASHKDVYVIDQKVVLLDTHVERPFWYIRKEGEAGRRGYREGGKAHVINPKAAPLGHIRDEGERARRWHAAGGPGRIVNQKVIPLSSGWGPKGEGPQRERRRTRNQPDIHVMRERGQGGAQSGGRRKNKHRKVISPRQIHEVGEGPRRGHRAGEGRDIPLRWENSTA